MDRFLDNAARILEGGRSAHQAGCTQSAWTILMGGEGGVRMIADSDWPLESLARESGADMAYRVSFAGDEVNVSGCSGHRKCNLTAMSPAAQARALLYSRPQLAMIA